MILQEAYELQGILDSFLGKSKNGLNDDYGIEYPCPCCVENKGDGEIRKYNLSLNIKKNVFNCWSCGDIEGMKGSVIKLIKRYGNRSILSDYRRIVKTIRESKLYELHFGENDFNVDRVEEVREELKLPPSFHLFTEKRLVPSAVSDYLSKRGIGKDILLKHRMGYTTFSKNEWTTSSRIIIPSYDRSGELNYWTGRDYTGKDKRMKYFNTKANKKEIIFNEELIQWDADITLVEGPFDHIVVPNSIPLLGKVLTRDFRLYGELYQRSNANINIFLDGDAYENVIEIYKLLNHGRLYDKIRFIPCSEEDDPSEIYQREGYKGIMRHLAKAEQIPEILLI